MRLCFFYRYTSALWKRNNSTLSKAPGSPSQAVKQLSNAELLNLVKAGNEDATLDSKNGLLLDGSQAVPSLDSDLPRSPLEEPRLVEARTRRRKTKPPPSKERSPFQVKLERNPYGITTPRRQQGGNESSYNLKALALSSPPRLCLLTGVRLPNFFLMPFGLAKHPRTGAPWHLPRYPHPPTETEAAENDSTSTSSQQSDSDPISRNNSIRTATGTHFAASHEVLTHISQIGRPAYVRMLPFRWKDDPSLKLQDLVWREDMADFVLDLLRKNLVKDAEYLASRKAGYICACRDYDDVGVFAQLAAVLWLGPRAEDAKGSQGPPPYAMHHFRGRYIPCFNMVTLLGQAHLSGLRESHPIEFAGELAVVKSKRMTTRFQLELWNTLGFLAQQSTENI
ncbi:hypothetical protein ACLMJK_006658 [Lecanora helva]